ncbi:MAG: hypothetical protein NC911_10095 [Candidatus Omnitrophica bacterium]|nr:hypothetical protein [Candidatus Omnitrophota bacterium]
MKSLNNLSIFFPILIFFIFSLPGRAEIKLLLEAAKKVYWEEEYVFLSLKLENTASETETVTLPYLQPRERKCLFVGQDFTLRVTANDQPLLAFTNHMPPEPRPGQLKVTLAPGEILLWYIPFPYDYYPVNLPCSFRLRVIWRENKSNEVSFQVLPSPGFAGQANLLVNGDFSQGETFLCGWKIDRPAVFWEKNQKVVHFLLDVPTATGEGLWMYSLFRPIDCPGSFTLEIEAKSEGPEIIVFVEGWGVVSDRRRRIERNECFAHPQTNDWQNYHFQVVFTKAEVTWVRLRVFAYGKAGSVWFKKIVLNSKRNQALSKEVE